jgi:hypothetical protein
LLWDHDNLIGKVIEAREDSYGPWIKAQINLETIAGREAYAHLKAGDVDAMSFGFNVIQDSIENGIRNISEVRCLEASPCVFPANEQATIVSVRSEGEAEELPEGWADNILSRSLFDHTKGDLNKLAMDTAFTMEELRTMAGGGILNISSRSKLAELPETIRDAHQQIRSKAVQTLCAEIEAGGIDEPEMKQIAKLLENNRADISETVKRIRQLRTELF